MKKIRLDKYVADYTEMTRSQAREAIRGGHIRVNGEIVIKGDDKVSFSDSVLWDEKEVRGQPFQYIMLNKPAGLVSATRDEKETTVVEYIRTHAPVGRPAQSSSGVFYLAADLFPMGRLDKDTEGLLVLTNDGELAHRLLTPRNHVKKKYLARVDKDIESTDVEKMAEGVDMGEGQMARPAVLEILSPREGYLTITEGKFHQVKRMFAALGKRVIYLKRISVGSLELDASLAPGEWRFLTAEERTRLTSGRV